MPKNKYEIGDRVRTHIHFENDHRTEVDATICGVEFLANESTFRYKIEFEPEELDRELGSTGCIGFVDESDIIKLLFGLRMGKPHASDTNLFSSVSHTKEQGNPLAGLTFNDVLTCPKCGGYYYSDEPEGYEFDCNPNNTGCFSAVCVCHDCWHSSRVCIQFKYEITDVQI